MKVIKYNDLNESLLKPVIALGNFDGVHDGHKEIINEVIKQAQEIKGTSVVCTYEPNTKVFFGKIKETNLLMTPKEKYKSLESLGVDVCIVFSFTKEFSTMSAEKFVRNMLIKKIGMDKLVIGYDTNFGSDKRGDKEHLSLLSKKYNFSIVEVSPLFNKAGKIISSTEIRQE